MRQVIAFILIISVVSFQFAEALIFVSFKINQEYIAKNLCIEKDVEGSTCKGCCQLKKKLNEQKEQKEQLPPQQSNKNDFNVFTHRLCRLHSPSIFSKIKFVDKADLYQFQSASAVFHPPRFLG